MLYNMYYIQWYRLSVDEIMVFQVFESSVSVQGSYKFSATQ